MQRSVPWLIFIGIWVLFFYVAVKALGSAAAILALAFGSAYLFFPILVWLEKHKISRIISVNCLFIVLSGIIALTILLILPTLTQEIEGLLRLLPGMIARLFEQVKNLVEKFHIPIPSDIAELNKFIGDHLTQILQNIASPLLKSASHLVTGTLGLLLGVLNLILLPVFFFFLTMDFEIVSSSLRELVPKRLRPKARYYLNGLNEILAGYIRGQLIVCIVLCILYSGGLALLGVQFALLIGTISGILSFIPYLGATIFVVSSIAVSLWMNMSWEHYLLLTLYWGVVQGLESFILTPKLVGDRVGLRPLGAILALIICANIAGFWGLLVAVPLGGFAKFVTLDLMQIYRNSSFYKSGA